MSHPSPHLIEEAANHIIASHHMRIRFMHLLSNLHEPAIAAQLSDAYSPERIQSMKKQSLKLYAKFRVAGSAFRSLDDVSTAEGLREWMEVYEDAKVRYDRAVRGLRRFEREGENLAVEWEAATVCPVPWVEVGGLYPGIEDLDLVMEFMADAKGLLGL